MLIDAAKGVEPQTEKLFAVAAERGIPLFTFMNKLDRPSRDPLELLDELESVLGIGAFPVNWPLGSGDEFKGVYDRRTKAVHLFERAAHGATRATVSRDRRCGPSLARARQRTRLRTVPRSDRTARRCRAARSIDAAMLRGYTTPVFFGSAVTNFGVQLFLDEFVEMAPSPSARAGVDPGRSARSRASSSRFRRTWILAIAIASRSCASARASSRAT